MLREIKCKCLSALVCNYRTFAPHLRDCGGEVGCDQVLLLLMLMLLFLLLLFVFFFLVVVVLLLLLVLGSEREIEILAQAASGSSADRSSPPRSFLPPPFCTCFRGLRH